MLSSTQQYLTEVRGEFNKITWPAQKEYVGGTTGVLVIVGIVAIVLGLIDFGLAQIMRLIVS